MIVAVPPSRRCDCLVTQHSPGHAVTICWILGAAGFTDTSFRDVREPVYYGANVDAAFDWVRGFLFARDLLGRLDATAAARAVERLRETLAKHHRADGVWFDARAWIVTAERH